MGQICQNIDSHAAGNNTPFPLSVKFCLKRARRSLFSTDFLYSGNGSVNYPRAFVGNFFILSVLAVGILSKSLSPCLFVIHDFKYLRKSER